MSQMTKALIIAHKSACNVSGETLTYKRGDAVLVEGVVALPGKTDAETFDKFGMATTTELQDWIVLQERLMQDQTPIIPARGDIVEMTADGLTLQFAVHHPNGKQPPFRRADTHGVILRIHTVAVEPPAADVPEDETGDE